MNKDVKQAIKDLRRNGFAVVATRNCHYRIYLNGLLITTLAGTPSVRRGLKNSLARCARAKEVME